jgi:hypothetical protein
LCIKLQRRGPKWVISAVLTVRRPLPVFTYQRTWCW